MANLKETAKQYEPTQTKNVSELEVVSTNLELTTEEFTKTDGETFTVDSVMVEGEKYRIPQSVIKQLKSLFEEQPDLKFFKVKKSGSGMNTSYMVIPVN